MMLKSAGRAIITLLAVSTVACRDQGPEGAPDAIGMIASVNMGRDRVNAMMLENVNVVGMGRMQLNVPGSAKVVWQANGKDVYSHEQSIIPGMYVRAWAKGALVEGNPPQMTASRVEVSYVRP